MATPRHPSIAHMPKRQKCDKCGSMVLIGSKRNSCLPIKLEPIAVPDGYWSAQVWFPARPGSPAHGIILKRATKNTTDPRFNTHYC